MVVVIYYYIGYKYKATTWYLNGFPMVVTLGLQYNIGETPTVILYTYINQLLLTSRALVANPKKTTLHGGQSRSWSAEQGKKGKKKKYGSAPSPHAARSGENKNKNPATHPVI